MTCFRLSARIIYIFISFYFIGGFIQQYIPIAKTTWAINSFVPYLFVFCTTQGVTTRAIFFALLLGGFQTISLLLHCFPEIKIGSIVVNSLQLTFSQTYVDKVWAQIQSVIKRCLFKMYLLGFSLLCVNNAAIISPMGFTKKRVQKSVFVTQVDYGSIKDPQLQPQ